MSTKQEKTALEEVSEVLRNFWLENSDAPIIKARHTELFIEPKIFTHGKVNSQISKLIVKEYLATISMEDIARGKIVITADSVKIKDDNGKLIAEVKSKAIINNMINKITNYLGKALSQKGDKDGVAYVEPHEDETYAFGDIRKALIHFVVDSNKNDSKNLVRDAIVLLKNDSGSHVKLTKP